MSKQVRKSKSEAEQLAPCECCPTTFEISTEARVKSEGRKPKTEIDPKAEFRARTPGGKADYCASHFEIVAGDAMILREEGDAEGKPRNLMERTARFGENILRFVKKVPRGLEHPENNRLVDQLVGAGTSIGANYYEADDAVSGKDFKNKIGICRKESKETMFFLRMIAASEESLAEEARELWREAKELNLIFGSIWRKS